MELVGTYSNSESEARLRRLVQAVERLKLDAEPPPLPELRPPQGQVLRVIKTVLASFPDGLRTVEIWRLVQAELGRNVPYSTIKDALSSNLGERGCFERLRHGVYRLARPT
ncbi:MAG: hypothetical protein ACYCX7_05840 [Solirubrobacteraceae bacterium]